MFVDYWTVRFSGESCALSFKCLKFVHRLLDCSVLRGELCFVLQVFKVCASIIVLFGSQGRAALRVSGVWIDLCDYWTVPFSGTTWFAFGCDFTSVAESFQLFHSPGERCFVFEIIRTLQLKQKCLFDHCLLLANLNKVPGRPRQKLTLELI